MVNLAFRQSFFTVKNGDGAYIGLHCLLRGVLLGQLVFMRQRPGRLLGLSLL